MTVLGFDGLAIGYGESTGLPVSYIGLLRFVCFPLHSVGRAERYRFRYKSLVFF